MKRCLPTNPASAKSIIAHLATWGEVAACEISAFSASNEWLPQLEQAGIVAVSYTHLTLPTN